MYTHTIPNIHILVNMPKLHPREKEKLEQLKNFTISLHQAEFTVDEIHELVHKSKSWIRRVISLSTR